MSVPSADAEPLDEAAAEALFGAVFDGTMADADVAALLTTLACRGESAAEIAGAARAMRAHMIPVSAPPRAIDVCGTGGDGQHTLNVSTAVALVVAAAGVPVAKHGSRAASSRAGAADTLEALGLDLDRASATAEATLADLGIGFLFAANHHPAMARIMPIRRAIGSRTIFNMLGPLANPAGVSRQLIGVGMPAVARRYAEALARLGTERALVVSGDEGLDELSLAGGNTVIRVACGAVTADRLHATTLGLPVTPTAAIRGGNAAHNAHALDALLRGKRGAYRDAVVLNAAAALLVADAAPDWPQAADQAAATIDAGLAARLLDDWIAATR